MGEEKERLLRQQEAEQRREQEERDRSGVVPPIRPWDEDDS